MVCIKCLARVPTRHNCPVLKCKICGSGHNVLLCNKNDQDKAFLIETESDITDEELHEFQDYVDNVFAVKPTEKDNENQDKKLFDCKSNEIRNIIQ